MMIGTSTRGCSSLTAAMMMTPTMRSPVVTIRGSMKGVYEVQLWLLIGQLSSTGALIG